MKYKDYVSKMSKIADIGHSIAVLSWDKEVNLPENSARFRSQQIASLSGIAHEYFTDEKFGNALRTLINDPSLDPDQKRNIELTLDDYTKATKLSQEFVIRKSKAISSAYHAWAKAKKENDFHIYIEPLDAVINICREESEILAYENHPYDAHLDKYEPGMTVSELEIVFGKLKGDLQNILKQVTACSQIDDSFLKRLYPKDKQWDYGIKVLEVMGYNFKMGRQDISTHPFTISFSPEDVRVTTRIDENDMANMLWSCIHEGGHALYEQGLPSSQYGLPLGSAVSLGIHESQSRLWENHVGRNISFWKHYYPKLQAQFSENLSDIGLTKFYGGINKVAPNLIRTEADELHYHLHVIIRYELEKEIFEGKIATEDLATKWNEKYKAYLGISSTNDSEGILQDIHWAHGSFGYFPTYSLGSLYASQFYAKAKEDIPELETQLAEAKFDVLLEWLNINIHQYGRKYEASELCSRLTGETLNSKYFLDYAKTKYYHIYGIKE